MSKLIVNVGTGEQETVALTPGEEAEIAARQAAAAARAAREAQLQALVDGLRPGPEIRQAVKAGTALTAVQLQVVVRWLVAREFLEEMIS